MRFSITMPVAIAATLWAALPAQALPVAPGVDGPTGGVIRVSDGCGPYGHRSHYGYCKDNANPEFAYQPHVGPRWGYGPGPGYYGEGYPVRRCFIRETYDGPVRVCR